MSKNLPFENLAVMCNVSDDELKKAKTSKKKVNARSRGTEITRTYESAVNVFKSKANVLSIARVRNTTSEDIVHSYCRKRLDQREAARVTALVLRAIS